MKMRKMTALFTAASIAATTVIASFPMSTAFAAVGSWTDNGDGSYSYTQGDDASASITALDIFSLKPENMEWTAVNYVSVDVTGTDTVQSVIGGDVGGNWIYGSSVTKDGAGTATVYLETGKAEVTSLGLEFWQIADNVIVNAGTDITVDNIKFSAEEMPDPIGSWYEKDGAWYYQNDDTADDNQGIDLVQYAADNNKDWAATKYISAKIETTGTAIAGIGYLKADAGDNWTDSAQNKLDNSSVTAYVATNGVTPAEASIKFWTDDNNVAIAPDQLVKVSEITFHDSYDGLVNAWYEKGEGTYGYTQGDDNTAPVAEFLLDLSDVTDWSAIKYISVDVEATAATQPVIGGDFGEDDWRNGNAVWMDGGTSTVYFECSGDEPQRMVVQFWTETFDAGAELTISNITFSTEEMPDPVGSWFEKDGAWYYKNGDTTKDYAGLYLMDIASAASVDWSAVKYISATVETEGELYAAIDVNYTDSDDGWEDSPTRTSNGTPLTLYFSTNGKTPVNANVSIRADMYDVALVPNQLVKVSNIVFSTEERDYTGVTGEWYEQNGKWHYTHGDDPAVVVCECVFDISSVTDWTAIKYISVDVEATATAQPIICGVYDDDEWRYGTPVWMQDGGKSTVYFECEGDVPQRILMQFWTETFDAGAEMTLSNIVFSTEERDYTGVTGEWYEKDGKWHYTHGDDTTQSPAPLDLLSLKPEDINWADVKYISAEITCDNAAQPAIGGNMTGIDDDWTDGNGKMMTEAGTVTAFFDTNGVEPTALELQFWHVDWDNNFAIAAGANITVSNIVFSTEERDYSKVYNEWYELDGKWYYRTGDEGADTWFDITFLKPDNTAWTDIEYISADITVDGKANPVLVSNAGNKYGTARLTEDATTTIYLNTFGKELNSIELTFWWYDDSKLAIAANTLITLSNVKFSTEPRDYSKVFDEWYQLDETTFEYKASTSDIEDPADITFNDVMDVDMTGVKYFTADITVDGTMEGALIAYSDENDRTKAGQGHTITDDSKTIYMFCDESDWNCARFDLWNIEAGTKVTVSNVKFYTEYITDYTSIVGQWVQIGDDDYYYNHGDLPEGGAPGGLPLAYDSYDMSDVQTISMKLRHETPTPELEQSAKVHVTGLVGDEFHPGYVYLSSTEEQTVVRKYRGILESNPMFEITWISPNLEVYITDLTFSTEEVAAPISTPNDVVVDDNETVVNSGSGYCVMWFDLAKIEVVGTLKYDVELTESATDEHYVDPAWNDWTVVGEDGWIKIYDEPAVVTENCTMEIPITEDILKMIHETASHECEIAVQGKGIKVSNFIFTPKTDAPEPDVEEFKPDTLPEEEKKEFEEKLEQSKENTVDEKEAKDHVHNKKPQGHKHYKKDKHGRDIYSLRIVQMVDKKDLKHAESVSITVYSKKAKKYVTFTAECCFSYLNINGEKVKAGGDGAFLTVIIDNVHADDEITFTEFTINYKK